MGKELFDNIPSKVGDLLDSMLKGYREQGTDCDQLIIFLK